MSLRCVRRVSGPSRREQEEALALTCLAGCHVSRWPWRPSLHVSVRWESVGCPRTHLRFCSPTHPDEFPVQHNTSGQTASHTPTHDTASSCSGV